MQKELTYFKKDKPGHQYKYTSGASILSELKHLKDKYKVMLEPAIVEPSISQYLNEKGKTNFLFSSQGFMVWSDKNSEIKIPFFFTGSQNDPSKAFGSALTYSERYFILKFFGIPTDEIDPDKFQEKHKSKEELEKEEILKGRQDEVIAILRDMVGGKIDGFDVITRVKNSVKKHLKVKIEKMKEIPTVIRKVKNAKLLDEYASHLVETIEKFEKKQNEKD